MHQFFIFANKNNSNFGGKLNAIQANYVNFNPEIYNGNIQIVFFYNLDNLNLSNGQTPIKRILCQGHRKLKIGEGRYLLPGHLSSLIVHFLNCIYPTPSPFYFLYHFSFVPSAWDLSLEALSLLKTIFGPPPPTNKKKNLRACSR